MRAIKDCSGYYALLAYEKEVNEMKEGIHPNYEQTTIRCNCGNTFTCGSTKKEIRVEICSKCHPFYTGKPLDKCRKGSPRQESGLFYKVHGR